jgi:hypothetical protein
VGANGTMSVSVDFIPNLASFSLDLADATLGGSFDSSGNGDAYFSANADTAAILADLPELPIKPGVGVKIAGRRSTTLANNFVRFQGSGYFDDQVVGDLEMQFSPSGVWADGTFRLGSGFWAHLSGHVMRTHAELSGEAYVNIPIYGAKEVVSGTIVAVNYVHNGSVCGWTTAANAAECGWENFTDQFCRTFPWLCTAQPATCRFANSCTQDVWIQQTVVEPHFNYGSFTAKGHFSVSSPTKVTIDFDQKVCPPEVGACSVGAEKLDTPSPEVCVTSAVFGKFCAPLVIR